MCSNCRGDYEDPDLNPDYIEEDCDTKYGVADSLALDTGGLRKVPAPHYHRNAAIIGILTLLGVLAVMLALSLLFAGCAKADPLPDAPKPVLEPRRPLRWHLDTGWWTRAHATAAGFDGVTTALWVRNCTPHWSCFEADPVDRFFIGRHATPWRMGLFGTGEVIGTALIPNKKVRRLVQIGLITAHVVCGARNLR
jgi:hypothetical protein